MKRRTMFSDLVPGDTCETDCLLLRVTQRVSKVNGAPYVELLLSDGETVITAREFNTRTEDLRMEGVTPENVVRTVLSVDVFYNSISYIVCDIWAEDYYPEYIQEFLPKASINIAQSMSNILALIRLNSGIYTDDHAPVGRLAELVLTSNREEFCHSAGGASRHHDRIGGLLEHSLGVAKEASRIAEYHPELDQELLVAGAALHDIGKIRELHTSPCGNIEYRETTLDGGHALIGMKMIDEVVNSSSLSFDPERVSRLKHIVGAHHGRSGSTHELAPAIPEARIVQLLDALDATLDSFQTTTAETRMTKIDADKEQHKLIVEMLGDRIAAA